MGRFYKTVALIFIGAILLSGGARGEIVERIAAVVGNRIILASEVAAQVQMFALQAGNDLNMSTEELTREILTQMVNDALILQAAREDTTINVRQDEVDAALQEHIASLAARFPSEEAFVEQLRREGLTKRTLEKKYRSQIQDQLLKEKIINKRMYAVSLTRQEVKDFYEQMADSLPQIPDKYRVAHILTTFDISPATDDSLLQMATEAWKRITEDGADLNTVTAEFQNRTGQVIGGRVGFIHRDDVVPEFGQAAFALSPGEYSPPIRSSYGYHIIECHNKISDSIDVSQILFPATPSAEDSTRTLQLADSLYNAILAGSDFGEIAKEFSRDDSTRSLGGVLPEMSYSEMRPEFADPINKLAVGEISQPVPSQLGYHIIKLLEKTPGRALDPDKDFDILRNIARQRKTGRVVEEWVEKLRQEIYVDVRDDVFN